MKQLKIVISIFMCVLVLSGIVSVRAETAAVSFPATIAEIFPDVRLAGVIGERLGKNVDDMVTETELKTSFQLFNLDISDRNISSLEGLQHVAVTQLTARNNNITDVSPLDNIGNLRRIFLDGNPLTSLGGLGVLPNLQMLSLTDTLLTDLDLNHVYPNVQTLYLSDTKVQSLSDMSALPDLRSLYLENTPFADLGNLTSLLPSLSVLDISYTEVTDLAPLSAFTHLSNLSFSGNPDADFTTLPYISTLAGLVLNHNNLSDLSFLSSYTSLPTLHLSDNRIHSSDVLKSIQIGFLYLDGNGIGNEPWLADLKNVFFLNLNRNHITDLTFLESLPDLRNAGITEQVITAAPLALPRDSYQMSPQDNMKLIEGFEAVVYDSEAIYDETSDTLTWYDIKPDSTLEYMWVAWLYGSSRMINYNGSYIQPVTDVGYRVSYVCDDTLWHVQEGIHEGSLLVAPDDPEKENHRFIGWYRDEDFTEPWDFDENSILEHLMLFARFEKIQYTVIFDSQGGSSVSGDVVDHDLTLTAPSDPVREGYRFMGWYTSADFSVPWDFILNTVTQPMILYARWEAEAPSPQPQPNEGGGGEVNLPEETLHPTLPVTGSINHKLWAALILVVSGGGALLLQKRRDF